MTWLRLVMAALACFRLVQLITVDEGPGDIFDRIRVLAGCYELGPGGEPETALGRFLACPYCVGVWLAVPFAALALWPTGAGDVALAIGAVAGGQAVLEDMSARG